MNYHDFSASFVVGRLDSFVFEPLDDVLLLSVRMASISILQDISLDDGRKYELASTSNLRICDKVKKKLT